jgi:hypothetical protein
MSRGTAAGCGLDLSACIGMGQDGLKWDGWWRDDRALLAEHEEFEEKGVRPMR